MPPDDSLSSAEIDQAIADVLPDAEVRDATPVGEGKNTTYAVEVETETEAVETAVGATDTEGRDLVLKVGDHHFAAGCRAEPHVLAQVAERTAIPVPAVLGAGHLDGDPYFLAERVPGVNPTCDPQRLPDDAFERVVADAGRYLGELHAAFPADGWGMLGLERGADDRNFAREFPNWPTYFEAWLDQNVDRLRDTRFADLAPALEAKTAEAADELREHGPFDPVLSHGDYRLGNLLVDPDTGATEAVIDWATPTAVTPAHDLAVTEAILLDWPELRDERQQFLRERLHDGYRETNSAVLDREGFEARRRLCKFGARLRLMVNLDEEMTGRPADAVDARAREHREALREYGVE